MYHVCTMGTHIKVRNTILSVRCSLLKTSTVFPQSDMTTAKIDRKKLKRFDTLTPTAVKDMSETIVPDYIKLMLIYCFNGPTLTSIHSTGSIYMSVQTRRQFGALICGDRWHSACRICDH